MDPAGADGDEALVDDDDDDEPTEMAVCAFVAHNGAGNNRGSWKPLQPGWKKKEKRDPRRIGYPPLSFVEFFARRHILSPVKTVRSNLHCKTTLQQNPVGRFTRWMPPTPLGQWKFGCSAPQDPAGLPPAHEGVIYAIYHEGLMCIQNCKRGLANRGYFRLWSGWITGYIVWNYWRHEERHTTGSGR